MEIGIIKKAKEVTINVIVFFIALFTGLYILNAITNKISSLGWMGSKKGMLANLIGGFVVILVGVSLLGTISQEMNNAICPDNMTIDANVSAITTDAPNGATDSFGGGGTSHFGGYDGTVKHENWFANLAPIKTNKSLFFNGDNCISVNGGGATILNLVPAFFALGILGAAIAMVYSSLRTGGFV